MHEREPLTLPGFGVIEPERVVSVDELFAVVRDKYPVSPGHTLIIARRPVQFFRDLTDAEKVRLMELVTEIQTTLLQTSPKPDGFNLGVNDGRAAGQTIAQFHFHVIPRFVGDVSDARGGIRWVKPDCARYWKEESEAVHKNAIIEPQETENGRDAVARELCDEVFRCEACGDVGAFRRPLGGGPFYKFPALIGAQNCALLLFIGINPRRSKRNLELHEWLMASSANFAELASNRQADGQQYISGDGDEEHYHCHAMVVEGVFGTGTPFETKAAVTELYLCASETGSELLKAGPSACAERFLQRSIAAAQPMILIAVGATVRKHLQRNFPGVLTLPLIEMVHPRELFGRPRWEKLARLEPTIQQMKRELGLNKGYITSR
jgi:diadenosine tetraphosphate (Ap4A) HIT family hydrolase